MKHSKTPWTVEEPNFNETTVSIACNDGYEYIAHLTQRALMFDDAKHIVKCVNHFEEMKAVLEDLAHSEHDIDVCYSLYIYEAKKVLEKIKEA